MVYWALRDVVVVAYVGTDAALADFVVVVTVYMVVLVQSAFFVMTRINLPLPAIHWIRVLKHSSTTTACRNNVSAWLIE